MRAKRVLILGGTRDARALASALIAAGLSPVTSLAGVTEHPALPPGEVRRGGFGGADGLKAYLKQGSIAAVVDATHPFAARIAAQAYLVCQALAVPLLRLERPPWQPGEGDRWMAASSVAEAVTMLPDGARALVTIGRKEIGAFLARTDIAGVARMIEPPAAPIPPQWTLVLERPPFTVESERQLITGHTITHLVSKNAGGDDTAAKIEAARMLGLPVIMIARPVKPEVPTHHRESSLVQALRQMLLP
jgi:precorrin-6A/cobalt-precorrin-6A reductase